MNLRDAITKAKALGATVTRPRKTGEILFRHPAVRKRVRHNGRRKCASKCLRCWLKKIGGAK